MLIKYRLEYLPSYFQMEVEIDEDFIVSEYGTTKDAIKAMVDFWFGSTDLLDFYDGDYTKAFLNQLFKECIRIQIGNNYNNLYGVISKFRNSEREGWTPMDGSFGIKITFIDDFEFLDTDISIEIVNK